MGRYQSGPGLRLALYDLEEGATGADTALPVNHSGTPGKSAPLSCSQCQIRGLGKWENQDFSPDLLSCTTVLGSGDGS